MSEAYTDKEGFAPPDNAEIQRAARDAITEGVSHFPELENRLVGIFGFTSATVFMHQLIWWFGRPKMYDRWTLYKTADEWYSERRLNRKALSKARKRAIAAGVVTERMGPYKRLHYSINWCRLADLLGMPYDAAEPDEATRSGSENGGVGGLSLPLRGQKDGAGAEIHSTPLRGQKPTDTFKGSGSSDTFKGADSSPPLMGRSNTVEDQESTAGDYLTGDSSLQEGANGQNGRPRPPEAFHGLDNGLSDADLPAARRLLFDLDTAPGRLVRAIGKDDGRKGSIDAHDVALALSRELHQGSEDAAPRYMGLVGIFADDLVEETDGRLERSVG